MRIAYWDSWKGLAIIAVVFIHASGSAGWFPANTSNSDIGVALRQFINFPVAFFVFLSAYFAARPGRAASGYLDRTLPRVWRLTLPYLIWAFIYSAARLLVGRVEVGEIPLMLLNGNATVVGYYVIVMIQLSVLSPALERLSDRALSLLLPVSIAISLAFTYSVRLLFDAGPWGGFPYNALPFFVWLPFYLGGLLAARRTDGLQQFPIRIALGGFALGVCLSLVEAFYPLDSVRELAVSQLKFTSMLASGFMCLVAVSGFSSAKNYDTQLVSWFGRRSYYFYLSHMLVLPVVQKGMQASTLLYDYQLAFITASAVVTLGICAAGAWLADMVLQDRESGRRAIGLA